MALFPGFDSAEVDDPRKKVPASGESSNLSGSLASSKTEEALVAPVSALDASGATPFQIIQDLMQIFTTYSSTHKMLWESLKIVAAFLDVEFVILLQADRQTQILTPLRPVYCALPDSTQAQIELEALRLPIDGLTFSASAFRQETTFFTNKGDLRLSEINSRYNAFKIRSIISLPLRLEGQAAGVLCALNKRSGELSLAESAQLESLAPTLALLLKNVQLFEQTEHQERRHEAVVEAAVDGFIEVNRDMRIIQFSKGAELLTGWQKEDALGHTCQEILQPHSPENEPLCTNCPLRRSFRSGSSVSNVETLIRNQEGEDNWVSCSYNSVTDERGQVRSGIIAIKDIYRLKALSDELRQQSQQQESLIGVNNAISGLSNIEDIFRVSLDAISRAIDFDLGTIHSLDPNTNELNLMALLQKETSKVGQAVSIVPSESSQGGTGLVLENEEFQRQARFRHYRADNPQTNQARDGRALNLQLNRHYAHDCEALRQNEPYLAVNLPDVPVCEVINDFDGLQSHICVPIKTHERNYGVLHLASQRPYAFWGSDFVLALSVCKQIAVGAERARLFEQIDRLARTDPLTGLYNKRELWERLDQEVRRAERRESPLSLVLVDLDRLKWINDYFGHAQGDALLMQLSELIRQQCRASDVAFRYGGDELCIMLPDTSQLEAKSVADRLRKAARAIHLGLDNDPVILGSDTLVTMSVGIASYPADGLNPAQLFESADAAMYRAKETGKDRAVIFDRQIDQHRLLRHRHLPDQDDRLTPPRRTGSASLPPH